MATIIAYHLVQAGPELLAHPPVAFSNIVPHASNIVPHSDLADDCRNLMLMCGCWKALWQPYAHTEKSKGLRTGLLSDLTELEAIVGQTLAGLLRHVFWGNILLLYMVTHQLIIYFNPGLNNSLWSMRVLPRVHFCANWISINQHLFAVGPYEP